MGNEGTLIRTSELRRFFCLLRLAPIYWEAEALSERAVAGAKLLMELSAVCGLHSALQL